LNQELEKRNSSLNSNAGSRHKVGSRRNDSVSQLRAPRHSREGGNLVARQRLQRQQEKSLSIDACEMKQPGVYSFASERNGTSYLGVTSNLI